MLSCTKLQINEEIHRQTVWRIIKTDELMTAKQMDSLGDFRADLQTQFYNGRQLTDGNIDPQRLVNVQTDKQTDK